MLDASLSASGLDNQSVLNSDIECLRREEREVKNGGDSKRCSDRVCIKENSDYSTGSLPKIQIFELIVDALTGVSSPCDSRWWRLVGSIRHTFYFH